MLAGHPTEDIGDVASAGSADETETGLEGDAGTFVRVVTLGTDDRALVRSSLGSGAAGRRRGLAGANQLAEAEASRPAACSSSPRAMSIRAPGTS